MELMSPGAEATTAMAAAAAAAAGPSSSSAAAAVVRDGDYAVIDENGERKSIVFISSSG